MKDDKEIEIESAEPLSPHNEALYEAGKEMLKSSMTTGRDFCQFMITVSSGAIPTFLVNIGLIVFLVGSISAILSIVTYALGVSI